MSHTAVVILNYNGEKFLQQFLPSVLGYSEGAEIVVADNASTDQSIPLLETQFPTVRRVQLDQNYGFCGGYNRALKQVTADYYVLLNSDIEVTPNWLSPMVQVLDNNKSVASVQPKILSFRQRDKFEHAGAAGGFIDSLGYPFCRGRIFDHVENDAGQYDDALEVFWSTGACMMIRAEAWHRFGGFDEDFFAHMEEIDLCWKLHRAGQKVWYTGKSSVYHVGAGTLGYGHPRKTYLNFRNGLFLIYRHLSSAELTYKLPFRILLDWAAALQFLVKGDPGNWLAIFRAHAHFFKNLSRERVKRRRIQKDYPSYSRAGIRSSMIVFDYYLRGKKTFGQ